MPDEITCRDSTWLVSEARERPLSEAELSRLKHHLAHCTPCQGASSQFAVMFRQVEALFSAGAESPDKEK